MTQLPVRRFQKLYERTLLSQWLSLVLGRLFVGLLPNLLYSELDSFQNTEYGQQSAFWINTVLYLISFLAIRRLLYSFPGGRSLWLVLSHVFVIFALGVFVSLFFRIQVSRLVLMLVRSERRVGKEAGTGWLRAEGNSTAAERSARLA